MFANFKFDDIHDLMQELQDSFKLKQYILVSRVFTDPSAPVVAPRKKQKAVSPLSPIHLLKLNLRV